MNPTSSAQPKKTRRRIPISNVAVMLIVTTLAGQLLGFLRTRLINANFDNPMTPASDRAGIYFAAFNIPDFFFYTIAAGALGVAFMPYLSDRLYKGDRRGMWELTSSIMNLLSLVMLVIGIIILIFAQPLIHLVASGLEPVQIDRAATLMRFLALNPFLFTISGILTSAQQTLGRFFFYAIAPLFYNLSIIASIYIFKGTSLGIVGLGVGALIGALIQLAVIAAGLINTHFHWRPKIAWRSSDFRGMLRQLPPRSLDQGMDQVQSLVETRFASHIGNGAASISIYNNAYILHTAPILLLGTAISTAAFPRLNQRLSQNRPDLFRKDFLQVLRTMIWLAMPVVIIAYFSRGYLARLIFSNNAPDIAMTFGFLTAAIFFRTVYAIISRWFYAQKDTKTPLFVSVFTIAFNIALTITLSRLYGVPGLAMAQSAAAAVEVLILAVIMIVRDRGLLDRVFWGGVSRIVSVTGFTVVAAFVSVSFFPLDASDRGMAILGKLTFVSAVVIAVHMLLSWLFGLEEMRPVIERLKRWALRPVHLDY
mgnify:CR=1 FL=1